MKKKSNLDEMQEQKLLQIEHRGCWLAFWGLLAVMMVQAFLLEGAEVQKALVGEGIVFWCLCVYLTVACLRAGIWDRTLKPTLRTNLLVSVATGAVVGVFNAVKVYRLYEKAAGSVATGIFVGGFAAMFVFAALSAAGAIYRRRAKELEAEDGESAPKALGTSDPSDTRQPNQKG